METIIPYVLKIKYSNLFLQGMGQEVNVWKEKIERVEFNIYSLATCNTFTMFVYFEDSSSSQPYGSHTQPHFKPHVILHVLVTIGKKYCFELKILILCRHVTYPLQI